MVFNELFIPLARLPSPGVSKNLGLTLIEANECDERLGDRHALVGKPASKT